MSYVVLARKWRPQTFADLIGQEHVATTLANAIAQDRVAHAFLFTGVRGVGKTSSARILAKALNCAEGPTASPCGVCPMCVEIAAGNDMDVQEIDGASYNGVDEVRRLQESLPYRPGRDRFKLIIVDEVHMLSNAAWNAFLKTLEEPPPHVKFIFATTEVQKVPVTILSRCQRYDFKLIGAAAIAKRLRFVLDEEGVKADDAALAIIAREAAGSMRDAMSLLDQVIAWSAGDDAGLTASGVAEVLGVAQRESLHKLAAAVVEGDPARCLDVTGELAGAGHDIVHLTRDLLSYFRDLVVAKTVDKPEQLLEMGDAEVDALKGLAESPTIDDLARLHQGLSKSYDDIAKSPQPRAALEMTLVRLARRPALIGVDELLGRLADLEQRLGRGGATGRARRETSPRGGSSTDDASAEPPEAHWAPTEQPTEPYPRRDEPAIDRPRPSFDATARPRRPQFGDPPPMADGALEEPEPVPAAPPAERPPIERPPARRDAEPGHARRPNRDAPSLPVRPQFDEPAPVVSGPTEDVIEEAAASLDRWAPMELPPPPVPAVRQTLDAFRAVVEAVRAERPALASVLEHARVEALSVELLSLAYPKESFLAEQVTQGDNVAVVERIAGKVLEGEPRVEVTEDDPPRDASAPPVTLAQVESNEKLAEAEGARQAVVEHPLVEAAVELLGAELRDVRLAPELEDRLRQRRT